MPRAEWVSCGETAVSTLTWNSIPTVVSLFSPKEMANGTRESQNLIENRCRLCSRLSSALREFYRRCSGGNLGCRDLSDKTLDAHDRLAQVNLVGKLCSCERFRMSKHSPCPVRDFELVDRAVFSIHVNADTGLL